LEAAPDDAAAAEPVPALVRVLAGNSVTSITIFGCLNTVDTLHARQLHPAVAGAIAAIPWCDTATPVVDPVRWRAGFPAAMGARLAASAVWDLLTSKPAGAALGGITHLDLHACGHVTDELLLRLPVSLRVLNVHTCYCLTARASFVHLTALASLDCSRTKVISVRTDGLPPSLRELDISWVHVHTGASLAHLRQLRALRADWSGLGDVTLASLPPCLEELHASGCSGLTPAASFAHLAALRTLDITYSPTGDASLAAMPPYLVSLDLRKCKNLTPAAVLPPLPALRLLDVSGTDIGDALLATLPPSLVELRLGRCRGVTAGARLGHLRALRVLHCIGTELASAALAGCRARGCAVPAASVLRGHGRLVKALTVLADGRLASGDSGGEVRVWDVAAGVEAPAILQAGEEVGELAALRDGRLAIGANSWDGKSGCVEVWVVGAVPPMNLATIDCRSGVLALATLTDGRLAAGCADGAVRVIKVDAGAVVVTLTGHTSSVMALVVLPDGALASGSRDNSVRVWDVGSRMCIATLAGHTSEVACLAVLDDVRLASCAYDGSVLLWDVGTRACVGVLAGNADRVTALAALPDGRLASGSADGTLRLWDTRPSSTAPMQVVGVLVGGVEALVSLPDGRLACSGDGGTVCLLELPPPAT